MFQKLKSRMKGSVLIFTLLLLSIALMAALSLATAVVVGTKSARDTNKSVQAFQTADSGVEKILMAIKSNTTDNLSDLGTCSGGNITGTVRAGDSYAITLYDGEDKEVSCSDTNRKVSEIRKIKSVGKFGGSVRAVETAVAANGATGTIVGSYEQVRDNAYNPLVCSKNWGKVGMVGMSCACDNDTETIRVSGWGDCTSGTRTVEGRCKMETHICIQK
jgi:hypothetical protein